MHLLYTHCFKLLVMEKSKTLETSLVLTTGFLVIYVITKAELFLYISLTFAITGIFIKPVAKIIAVAWFKLAEILNYFFSKLIMGTLFFVLLFPVSLLYRIANNDKLNLKKKAKSNWNSRMHIYSSTDFENIW